MTLHFSGDDAADHASVTEWVYQARHRRLRLHVQATNADRNATEHALTVMSAELAAALTAVAELNERLRVRCEQLRAARAPIAADGA